MATLRPTCPTCGAPLRGVAALDVATVTARRTCRCCGSRWQIVTRPLSVARDGNRSDLVHLTRMETP